MRKLWIDSNKNAGAGSTGWLVYVCLVSAPFPVTYFAFWQEKHFGQCIYNVAVFFFNRNGMQQRDDLTAGQKPLWNRFEPLLDRFTLIRWKKTSFHSADIVLGTAIETIYMQLLF